MNDLAKNLLLWVVVAVVLMVVFQSFSPNRGGAVASETAYSDFLQEVNNGRVQSVEFTNDTTLATNATTSSRTGLSAGFGWNASPASSGMPPATNDNASHRPAVTSRTV